MGSRTRFELKTLQVYCFSNHFFHLLKFSEPPKSSIMRLSVKALQPMGRILYQNYSIPTLTLVVSLAFTNTKFIQFTFKFSQSYNFKTIQNFRVQKKLVCFQYTVVIYLCYTRGQRIKRLHSFPEIYDLAKELFMSWQKDEFILLYSKKKSE